MQRKKRKKPPTQPSQTSRIPPQTLPTFEIKAAHETRVSFSGPVPPPEILQAYNKVMPDGAERILSMAERQSLHRQELEKIIVKGNSRHQAWGISAAFLLSIVTIAVGVFLIYNDKDASGLAIIIADLVALAGVFVYARQTQQKERSEKSQPFRSG